MFPFILFLSRLDYEKKRSLFDILVRMIRWLILSACSPIEDKLHLVKRCRKGSLFGCTRTSCNCFVIREHTIETESSRGLFGVKLLVLAALGGPLVAKHCYFYGWSLCERKGEIETDALLGVYTFIRCGQKLTGLNSFSLISLHRSSQSSLSNL